jgi:hypothetical protein
MLCDAFYNGLTFQSRSFVDNSAGRTIFDLETQAVLDLFERLAQQQQWSNRELVRSLGGRHEVDPLALMQAKIDALQLQVEMQRGASKMVQVQACSLCGDETHDYYSCPFAQPEGGVGQAWRDVEPNYPPHFHQPKKDALPQHVVDFMHEQGKMNQMLFEQLKAMNEKLSRLSVGESSGNANGEAQPKLPSQSINSQGEMKAIHVLGSDTQCSNPPMPEGTQQGTSAGSPAALSPEITVCAPADRPCSPVGVPCGPQVSPAPQQTAPTGQLQGQRVQQPNAADPSKVNGKLPETKPPYRSPVHFSQRLTMFRLNEQPFKIMEGEMKDGYMHQGRLNPPPEWPPPPPD